GYCLPVIETTHSQLQYTKPSSNASSAFPVTGQQTGPREENVSLTRPTHHLPGNPKRRWKYTIVLINRCPLRLDILHDQSSPCPAKGPVTQPSLDGSTRTGAISGRQRGVATTEPKLKKLGETRSLM
uniref:Ovule protein n=1 Tax=Mesocestoides corti TaxID=53468 RepID=A0A5K3G1U8_MESCO